MWLPSVPPPLWRRLRACGFNSPVVVCGGWPLQAGGRGCVRFFLALLCCAVPCCGVLCRVALHCGVLCCVVGCCLAFCCAVPCFSVPCCVVDQPYPWFCLSGVGAGQTGGFAVWVPASLMWPVGGWWVWCGAEWPAGLVLRGVWACRPVRWVRWVSVGLPFLGACVLVPCTLWVPVPTGVPGSAGWGR